MVVLFCFPEDFAAVLVSSCILFAGFPFLIRTTPLLKYTLDEIAPLKENADSDIPVAITYLLGEFQLGVDNGYLGLRKEGISFNGVTTTFLVDPSAEMVTSGVCQYESPFARISLPYIKESYQIQVETYSSHRSDKPRECAWEIKRFIVADRTGSPSTTIHNLPPLTVSPSRFVAAILTLCKLYAAAALIPGLTVLFLVWWFKRAAEPYPVAIVLSLIVLGILVVLFVELLPSALVQYRFVLKLDQEASARTSSITSEVRETS